MLLDFIGVIVLSILSFFGSRPVLADGLIQVNQPASNQVLSSNTDNVFQYTVVGAQTGESLQLHECHGDRWYPKTE